MIRLDVFAHVGGISEASLAEITFQSQALVDGQLVLVKPVFSSDLLTTFFTLNQVVRVLQMPLQGVII